MGTSCCKTIVHVLQLRKIVLLPADLEGKVHDNRACSPTLQALPQRLVVPERACGAEGRVQVGPFHEHRHRLALQVGPVVSTHFGRRHPMLS